VFIFLSLSLLSHSSDPAGNKFDSFVFQLVICLNIGDKTYPVQSELAAISD